MRPGRARRAGPSRVVVGVIALVGALVVAYLTATPTLACRPDAEHAACTLTAKALGLVEVARRQVANVRSVSLALPVVPGNRLRRPAPRLMFHDGAAGRPLGYFSVHFVGYADVLDAYVRQPTAAGLLITPPLKARTILARAAGAALAVLGVWALLLAARGRP